MQLPELCKKVLNGIKEVDAMGKIIHNKLVRDKILDIISSSDKNYTYHIAEDKEYACKLNEKVLEELHEFSLTPNVEEAADILEVVSALFAYHGLTMNEIEKVRADKVKKRGGFIDRIILEAVQDDAK